MVELKEAPAGRATQAPVGSPTGRLIDHLAARAQDAVATAFLQKRHGVWRRHRWAEVWQQVQVVAAQLRASGFAPGQSVALLSGARAEAVTAVYACQHAGLRPVLLNPQLGPGAVATSIQDGDCVAVIAEDQEQVDKVADVQSRLPALRRVWVIDPKGVTAYRHIDARPFSELTSEPNSAPSAGQRAVPPASPRGHPAMSGPDTDAVALFTAGVHREPRLVSVSHATLIAALSAREGLDLSAGQPVVSLFGLADSLGHFFSVVAPLLFGCVPCFGEDRLPTLAEMRECSPQAVAAPARLLDRLRRETAARAQRSGGLRQRWVQQWMASERPAAWLRHGIGRPLANGLGLGECRWVACGYDRMSAATARFLSLLGIRTVGLYGLAEAAGPVGRFEPAHELALSLFSAYPATVSAQQQLTVAVAGVPVTTGDLVSVDSGRLELLGRAADLLTLADGGQLSPAAIEAELMASPYINQAVAVGGPAGGVTALIELDEVTLRDWAQGHSLAFTTLRSFAESSEVLGLVGQAVQEANQRLPAAARVAASVLLPRPLDAANGELTPSLALRRTMVRNRYAHRLIGVTS